MTLVLHIIYGSFLVFLQLIGGQGAIFAHLLHGELVLMNGDIVIPNQISQENSNFLETFMSEKTHIVVVQRNFLFQSNFLLFFIFLLFRILP